MKSLRLLLLTALVVGATACGSSNKTQFTISSSDLDQQAAAQLAATAHNGTTPTINCANDLQAVVGNKETCVLTTPGNPNSYNAYITVTSVDNAKQTAGFRVDVSQSPNP